MFADLTRFPGRRGAPERYDRAFVREVVVRPALPRNRRLELLLLACWLLIAVKQAAVVWAVHRYHVPFDPLWVNGPTFAAALLCTLAYYLRD